MRRPFSECLTPRKQKVVGVACFDDHQLLTEGFKLASGSY